MQSHASTTGPLCPCGCGQVPPQGQPYVNIGHYSRAHAKPLAERFWRHVTVKGPDDCWEWTGSKTTTGYGHLTVENQKQRAAHRVSYELAYGYLPAGLDVCHACDNPLCVNPKHLFLGTAAINIADAKAKGRWKAPPLHQGEQQHRAKLTEEAVRDIRRRAAAGEAGRKLAREYAIADCAIFAVIHRKTWKHIT